MGILGRRIIIALSAVLALFAILLTIAIMADGSVIEQLVVRPSDAQRIMQAQRWISPSIIWEPPASIDTADDAVAAQHNWAQVKLPDSRLMHSSQPKTVRNGNRTLPTPPLVVWYKIAFDAVPAGSPDLRQIYLPRVFSEGTAALYVDGRLVWHTPMRYLFNPYNKPVLVTLDEQRAPDQARPHIIYIRLAARESDGGALSAIWLAQSNSLTRAFLARDFLQVGALEWTWYSYWVLGALSFVIWIRLRGTRESGLYFWFTATALLAFVPSLTQLSSDFAAVPDDILLWLWITGGYLLLICDIKFSAEIFGKRQPIFERLAVIVGLSGATYVSIFIALNSQKMLPNVIAEHVLLLLIIPFFLQFSYLCRAAFLFRTRRTLVIFALSVFALIALYHDLHFGGHAGGAEDLPWQPLNLPTSFIAYIVILFRSYVRSIEAADNATIALQQALRAKEAELGEQHQQLMRIQQEHTLTTERQRMMKEMHDGIGHSLVSALSFVRHGQKDPKVLTNVLEECIDDLKLSIDSLEPTVDDLLLLLSSLRYRLGSRLEGSGIKLHWEVTDVPPLPWLDPQYGMHILRILQEILTNLLKHSGADTLHFTTITHTRAERAGVLICIEDNGKPFTLPPLGKIQPGRKGLGNVISRTEMLQGHCQWQPLKAGNRFTLWVPLVRSVA